MMICLDLISLKGSQFYLHLHFYIYDLNLFIMMSLILNWADSISNQYILNMFLGDRESYIASVSRRGLFADKEGGAAW